jgi:hypothetical protein
MPRVNLDDFPVILVAFGQKFHQILHVTHIMTCLHITIEFTSV